MSYWKDYLINQSDLLSQKSQLMDVSLLSPNDIMLIWRKPNEETISDFDNIEYNFMMPLYKKMILRFKNEGRSDPAAFIKSMDPSNQNKISLWYGIYNYKIFEFFAYLKNQFSVYQIDEMDMDSNAWKSNTSIKFFFDLSETNQKRLIDMYNKTFDELIKEEKERRRMLLN